MPAGLDPLPTGLRFPCKLRSHDVSSPNHRMARDGIDSRLRIRLEQLVRHAVGRGLSTRWGRSPHPFGLVWASENVETPVAELCSAQSDENDSAGRGRRTSQAGRETGTGRRGRETGTDGKLRRFFVRVASLGGIPNLGFGKLGRGQRSKAWKPAWAKCRS